MKKKDIVVIGLGTFGYEVAIRLNEMGHHVMAIDLDMKKVNDIKEHVEVALQADITDPDVLKKIDIVRFDEIILGMSSSLEAIILAITHMKKMGVHHITGKANTRIQKEILLKIGADRIILPEIESADRLAEQITHPQIKEKLVVDDRNILMEIQIPEAFVGKSLRHLDLRNKYGINVIMLTRDGRSQIISDPDTLFEAGDMLLIVGDEGKIKKVFE